MNKCKECIWERGMHLTRCIAVPFCVKEVKHDAKETKEALQPSRLSRANR